ncbi:hypothetical protein BDV96DRAFT_40908 [Lophiotrema nucula]|uniref:HORMA domain-containing protein n=1 Tax=Lophiotrema nucula TaxID=690887 RepID=A0A6A5Z9C1_9PLEO|nr:hypothetical protein BDV96DRAFT_40908 [Lophiotrema nucula]
MTLRMVRIAMRQLIRQTFVYCQRLPALPEHRFLKMHLTYNDTRPSDYHPPYFGDGEDDEMFYPDADWKVNQETAGAIDTGHHTICLRISHLELEGMDEMDSIDMDNLTIPQTLEYSIPTSRFDDLDLEKKEQPIAVPKPNEGEQAPHQPTVSERSHFPRSTLEESNATQLQHTVGDAGLTPPSRREVDLDIVAPLPRLEAGASRILSARLARGGSTSSRGSQTADPSQPGDVATREKLKVMLQPSQPNDVGRDTQQQNTQVQVEEITHAVPRLSQTVVGELEKRRSKQLPPRKSGLARQQESLGVNSSEATDSVLCECEDNKDEAYVIQCSFCLKWQHLQCYGYRHDGTKMPAEDHACYRCLLQGKDANLWDNLRWLALMRRAICLLETSGFSTNKQLQADLKRPAVTTSLVITELHKKEFLATGVGSKKAKAGKPKYSVNKNEPVWSRILQEYFDPVSKIAHFVRLGNLSPVQWLTCS